MRSDPPISRVTLALLASLLSSCEVVEEDEGPGASAVPTPPLSDVCSSSPIVLSPDAPAPAPQAVGAFCLGLSLFGDGDRLGCVPTGSNITQCVDSESGSDYAVRWSGGVGTAFAGQAALGRVTQQSASSYSIELADRQGRLAQAGQCSLIATAVGLHARFCAFR